MLCGVRPNGQDFARRSQVSSATVLRIARKPQDLQKLRPSATSEGCRRNTARCVYRLNYEIRCIIPSGRLISNHFPQRCDDNLTTSTVTCIFIREGVLIQRYYYVTIVQLSYGLRMVEVFDIQLTGPAKPFSMRNRRESALPLSYGCLVAHKIVRPSQ